MRDLPLIADPNLIVGLEHAEDAGVYKLRDDLAIIQTVDFFTPIVDDPYTFGQIAAVNALSDVYAMGGKPLTAMNIICFPINKMDVAILRQILEGGLDKIREADALLVGGHSVEDNELKYGLSVTGIVHPEKVLLNKNARVGDNLVLTKALGTGIVSTALKAGVADEELISRSVKSMTTLNKRAMELMTEMPDVHACTDITGFGFLGHACEMVEGSSVGLHIYASAVPFFRGVRELVEIEMTPGGLYRNKTFRMNMIEIAPTCPQWMVDILFDPQTAGGLLISLPAEQAEALIKKMRAEGVEEAAIVGEVTAEPKGKIRVT